MSDSDHHHARPRGTSDSPPLAFPQPDPLAGAVLLEPTHTAHKFYHAQRATRIVRNDDVPTVYELCAALHDVTLLAPAHTVCLLHEDILLRMAADLRTLGSWVQTALAAFRKSRKATSAQPAPALPQPPAPMTPQPAPSAPPRSPPRTASRAASPARSTRTVHDDAPSTQPESPPAMPITPPATTVPPPKPAPTVTPHPSDYRPPVPPGPRARVFIKYGKALRKNRPSATTIVDTLNSVLGDQYVHSISYERGDNLALYLHREFAAEDIMNRTDAILKSLRTLFPQEPGSGTTESDQPWYKVVLHSVPLPAWTDDSTLDKQLAFLKTDLCESNKLSMDSIRLLRPLCRRDDAERLFRSAGEQPQWSQTVTLLLGLADEADATRLRRYRAACQFAECRVSDYHPRDGKPMD